LHYCGGKLTSVDLSISANEHPCGCGSKGMKKGCCENKAVHVQFKADQKTQHFVDINFSIDKELFFSFAVPQNPQWIPASIAEDTVSHSPPGISKANPVYLLNQVFRILKSHLPCPF
jgi:hypothetical protein